jgi:hypothetical protein
MRGATGEGEGHEGWTVGAVGEEDEEGVSDDMDMVKYQDHWEMKSRRRVHHSAGYKSLYVNLNASSSCPSESAVD